MDTHQIPLICDTLNTAIGAVIVALGGNKRTGCMLWPTLPADEAGRKLAQCINPDRREKLSPDELFLLLREGRKIGCHTLAAYLMRECGYADPQPIEPEDERAALQRQFVQAGAEMKRLFAQMERAGLRVA